MASADPWASYAGKPLASRTRYYWSVRVWSRSGGADRVGEADVVRDGLPDRGRVARPVDRGPRARERRLGGRRRSRRRGDPRGGGVLPAGRLADERLRGGAQQERPGRVPRAAAGADAAQVVHARQAGALGPRLRERPRLRRAQGQRQRGLRQRARSRLHRLQPHGALHDARRDGAAAAGRERDRVRARLGPLRRRDAHVGLGLGEGAVARRPAAAARPARRRTPTAPRRSSARTTAGRSASTGRPATTATTSARPTTRAARSPDGIGRASTTRAGRRHGWWRRPRARCARRCRSRSVSSTSGRRERAASRRPASSSTTPARTSPAGPRSA